MATTDQISGGPIVPNYGVVSVSQFKKALNNKGLMVTVDDAISANVTSDINVQWRNGLTFQSGDTLYTFVKSTLGYTDAQMTTLLQYAATQQA